MARYKMMTHSCEHRAYVIRGESTVIVGFARPAAANRGIQDEVPWHWPNFEVVGLAASICQHLQAQASKEHKFNGARNRPRPHSFRAFGSEEHLCTCDQQQILGTHLSIDNEGNIIRGMLNGVFVESGAPFLTLTRQTDWV